MKRFLLSLLIAGTLVLGVAGAAGQAYAASPTDTAKAEACQGITGQTGGTCPGGGADLNKVLTAVLNVLSVLAGVIAVIMIIIAGMKYITSGGDAQAVASAKKTLIYAIVGLIVVATSQVIVHFVLYAAKA